MNKILTTDEGYDIYQRIENNDEGVSCRDIYCDIPGKCFRKIIYNPASFTESEIHSRDMECAHIIRLAIIKCLNTLKDEAQTKI